MSCESHTNAQFSSLVEQMGKLRVDELECRERGTAHSPRSPSLSLSPRAHPRVGTGSSSGVSSGSGSGTTNATGGVGVSQMVQNAYAQRVAQLEAQLLDAERRTERAEDMLNVVRLRAGMEASRCRADRARAEATESRALHAENKLVSLEARCASLERKYMRAEVFREAAEKRAVRADARRAEAEGRVLEAEVARATAELRCEAAERSRAQAQRVSAMTQSTQSTQRAQTEELARRATELNAVGSRGLLTALQLKMGRAERDWARELEHISRRLDELQVEQTNQAGQAEQTNCVVCLEPMLPGERVLRLACMHMFHENCLMPHIRNGTITRCPIDRTEIALTSIDTLPVWSLPSSPNASPSTTAVHPTTATASTTTTSPVISNTLQYSTLSVVESTSPLYFEGYSPFWLSDTDSDSDN